MKIFRTEHPRPDRKREDWINLNGQWDFEIDNSMVGLEKKFYNRDSFEMKINVPFSPETKLSGIEHKDFMNAVWYRRDMEIPKECPENFLQHFLDILNKYPMAQKVGFSIEIDDLPDHFINKDKVIEHESSFWKKEVEPGVYRAQIDTTFALYRPYCKGEADIFHEVYRTGKPYTIKHLPWYVDTHNMSEEELYYVNSINQSTHWTIISKNETK